VNWIIGDIHGMFRPLSGLLSAISSADPEAHLIFVGDYVNRGPDSRAVIELLLTLERATFLRGNHDDIFDLLVNGDCYICHPTAPSPLAAFNWFMQFGLAETLMSYGIDWAELESMLNKPSDSALARILTAIPNSHRQFMRNLNPVYESETVFAAHGYWNPDEPDNAPTIAKRLADDDDLRYQLLWGRFNGSDLNRKKRWKRTGYFGHTPVLNYRAAGSNLIPIVAEKVTLLDTASALSMTGMLSAVCVENGTCIQANRAGETTTLPVQP
jgi:hypothetical protein